jgi:hypothetical protein
MNRWILAIKYLDSWLSQLERRVSAGIGSDSDRELLLTKMLAVIEEVDACILLINFERRIISCRPNLKVENMYYRSNSLYLLIQ